MKNKIYGNTLDLWVRSRNGGMISPEIMNKVQEIKTKSPRNENNKFVETAYNALCKLPPGWEEMVDDRDNTKFYVNRELGIKKRDRPF